MSDTVGQIERKTQERVKKLFIGKLGYNFLGDWSDRENNRNVEREELREYLWKCHPDPKLISRAMDHLEKVAGDTGQEPLRPQSCGI